MSYSYTPFLPSISYHSLPSVYDRFILENFCLTSKFFVPALVILPFAGQIDAIVGIVETAFVALKGASRADLLIFAEYKCVIIPSRTITKSLMLFMLYFVFPLAFGKSLGSIFRLLNLNLVASYLAVFAASIVYAYALMPFLERLSLDISSLFDIGRINEDSIYSPKYLPNQHAWATASERAIHRYNLLVTQIRALPVSDRTLITANPHYRAAEVYFQLLIDKLQAFRQDTYGSNSRFTERHSRVGHEHISNLENLLPRRRTFPQARPPRGDGRTTFSSSASALYDNYLKHTAPRETDYTGNDARRLKQFLELRARAKTCIERYHATNPRQLAQLLGQATTENLFKKNISLVLHPDKFSAQELKDEANALFVFYKAAFALYKA